MWVPLVNGQHPECVPLSTWEKIGCLTIAYALKPLLVKPGLEILRLQSSLAHYVGWSHKLILDLRGLEPDDRGEVVVCSPFDGGKVKVSEEALSSLIASLKPDGLVPCRLGQALIYDVPDVFISDLPLHMATQGKVFSGTCEISLTDPVHRLSSEVIQQGCRCETCTLGLTRSYLFHLWQHVPGLCQRYLVQHNATVFFDCNSP